MRKKSFKLTTETNSLLDTKIQVKGNTAIITKFAARLLILIILIGVIIYSLPS